MKDDEKSACKEIGDCSSRERCFVVTPIGSEGNPIRRHIDGVIVTLTVLSRQLSSLY